MPIEAARTAIAAQAHRYVESQSHIATSQYVDTEAEQLRLEELLEAHKPRIPDDARGLDWLLRSPFRYPPLPYGSRFGSSRERGILYLSESIEALECEMAFYAFKFLEAMETPPARPVRRSVNVIDIPIRTAEGIDLTRAAEADWRPLVDPDSWEASRRFGSRARAAGAQAIRYPAARVPPHPTVAHCNIAVFAPAAVAHAGRPPIRNSYQLITSPDGVLQQNATKRSTRYFPAAGLRSRPF